MPTFCYFHLLSISLVLDCLVPGDQKGLFKLTIQLRALCFVCNTATGYVS
jgi:hypothetical protein